MAVRPSGTVSFLFSDIEGSTRLLLDLGSERYGEVLEEHRRLFRRSVAAVDGMTAVNVSCHIKLVASVLAGGLVFGVTL